MGKGAKVDDQSKNPTIKDVARYAGVSTATVSRVLSGKTNVDKKLTKLVGNAVKKLNYTPNRAARSLRVRDTLTIGTIIPDIQNPFYPAVIRGIHARLTEENYILITTTSDAEPDQERHQMETLVAEGVAGIIFAPAYWDASQYQDFLARGVKLVAIDQQPQNLEIDVVTVDNVAGAQNAVNFLIAHGHERIGLISGSFWSCPAMERQHGYTRALEDAGITPVDELIQDGTMTQSGGVLAMTRLLELSPRPTAVFSVNNQMTLGALEVINEQGLSIPDDIAIVGFDDLPWSMALRPPLTAVSQPTYMLGVEAARLLLERIKDPNRPLQHIELKTELIIRKSV
jgi:LacI family transcriptional regulator